MNKKETWVLNSSYEITAEVTVARAITLVVIDAAQIHEAYPGKFFHSPSLVVPKPKSIVLNEYVMTDHQPELFGVCSYSGVLERDGYRCAYCDRRAATVDHVFPRSRGGKTEWENCVASCSKCNFRKADQTPEEAGMPLLWHPYVPVGERRKARRNRRRIEAQERIWKGFLSDADVPQAVAV